MLAAPINQASSVRQQDQFYMYYNAAMEREAYGQCVMYVNIPCALFGYLFLFLGKDC